MTKEQEVQMLEQHAKAIEAQLEATRRRLEAVKKGQAAQQGAQPYYHPYGLPATYGYPPQPYVAPSPEEELASLEDYRRALDEEVKGVEARIEELKKNLGNKPQE
ncbi:MAG: DUF5320 domain-containing protein [Candidatus Brockarchaeota archaeon]|nr:DUF5320 domain-containing protein [Candidatus Brockarchaeota archaeon]